MRARIVIVGGGFAGLSAAYHLARAGHEVVLLEANEVGSEASGRSTGMLGPGVQGSITTLVRRHGPQGAASLFRATLEAVASALALIEGEKLACDLENNGQLLVARSERAACSLREQSSAFARLGFHVPFLEGDALEARFASLRYVAALRFEHAANLDPRALARALAEAAAARGAAIREHACVAAVHPGRPARLELASGERIDADQVVLATNAFTPELGFLRGRVVPLVTHVIATEPLGVERLAALGWTGREGVVEARRVFSYFRLDARGRLVFGGGAKLREDPREWTRLARELARTFPSLATARIDERWSGTMGFTLDRLPIVGALDEVPSVLHAGAWCGHGIALSLASGERIAELIADRASRARLPYHRGTAPWLPPDPLRAAGLEVYLGALRAADRLEGAIA